MNDDQINGVAQGIFLHLQENCDPQDAISVILCLILLIYQKAKKPDASYPIEEFADSFGKDMIHLWRTSTETLQ